MKRIVLALCGALLLGTGTPLFAQSESGMAVPPLTPAQENEAQAAMSRLRSPVTPSHTVDMCPSVGALRDSIRVAVAQGQSANQIVEDVVARHGEQLRLLPKRSGTGLLAWIATPLVLLVGVVLIVIRLRRGQSPAEPRAAVPELSAADRERVAAALQQWEQGGEVRL